MEICQNTGVDPDKRVKDLSEDEISKIATYIQQNYRVEGELRTERHEKYKETNRYRVLPRLKAQTRPSSQRPENKVQLKDSKRSKTK